MELSAEEAAKYDRQIRLWGVEAQKRMRSSKVLIAGMSALGAEIAKNITLAGVNTTITDTTVASAADLSGNFFLCETGLGQNRAAASLAKVKDLNPHVDVSVLEVDIGALADDVLKTFRCVVMCDVDLRTQVAVAERCHNLGIPVIASCSVGFHAFFWEDVGNHEYVLEYRTNAADGEAPKPPQRFSVQHKPLSAAMATPWSTMSTKATRPAAFAFMALLHAAQAGQVHPGSSAAEVSTAIHSHAQSLCSACGAGTAGRVEAGVIDAIAAGYGHELAAVATIVGGLIGNEVVKILTGREEPVCNLYAFDAMGGAGGNINTF